MAHDYLDASTLAALGSVELRARMIVEGLMQGMHRSPTQGVSVEFAQHRAYAAGDDTRFLDWKVFGKTDKLYLKQFQRETNLDLVVLIDRSGSMGYASGDGESRKAEKLESRKSEGGGGRRGSGSAVSSKTSGGGWRKFDHGAAAAAAVSYLALTQQDRVALFSFADHLEQVTRYSSRRDHWRAVAAALDGMELAKAENQKSLKAGNGGAGSLREPGGDDALRRGAADLGKVIDELIAKLNRRSLVVIVSDFLDELSGLERGLARLNYRRHDAVLLQVLDPAELTFPFREPSEFDGLEAEGRLPVDPQALRKAYVDALTDHLAALESLSRKFTFDHVVLNTSEPIGPALSHFLAFRASRLGR
ncbi:MAG: DUF58 domain-containing protein [Planctomycetota bacterium]